MSEQHYDHLKVPQLKEHLKQRGLKTTGKKVDMIDRLKDNDLEVKKEQGLILLFCKTMIGSYYNVWVRSFDTVATLKCKISERSGTPTDKLVLEYERNGKRVRLEDSSMICDYNIYAESTIHIILRLL
jgi:hypothetical protein